MISDSQIETLIDSQDDVLAKVLRELLNERKRMRLEIQAVRESRDFFGRQSNLQAFYTCL